jgi:hypothetical protein
VKFFLAAGFFALALFVAVFLAAAFLAAAPRAAARARRPFFFAGATSGSVVSTPTADFRSATEIEMCEVLRW